MQAAADARGADVPVEQVGPSQASTPAFSTYFPWGFLGPMVSPPMHTVYTTPPGRYTDNARAPSPETDLVSYAQNEDEA